MMRGELVKRALSGPAAMKRMLVSLLVFASLALHAETRSQVQTESVVAFTRVTVIDVTARRLNLT